MKIKKRNFNIILGSILSGIVLVPALIGLFVTPYDPETMDAAAKLSGISITHIMGCDNFGRDIFSRVMAGSSVTMIIAGVTVLIGVIIGTF